MNAPATPQRLEHFPVSFFASVMGTTGLALAWKKAHTVLGVPEGIGCALTLWATALFSVLALIYLIKVLRHWPAVQHEFAHPIRINFFPAFSISLLLLAAAFTERQPGLATGLWSVGALLISVSPSR